MLSAVLDRLKRIVGSTESNPDDESAARDDGPDLYECEGCGSVFISKPEQCSECEDDDFSNVGKFK
jgi:hypothetical protein